MLTAREREATGRGFDRIIHPEARGTGLNAVLLDWALTAPRERAEECGESVTVGAAALDAESGYAALLERYGFAPLSGYNLYLARPLDTGYPRPEYGRPAGARRAPWRAEASL